MNGWMIERKLRGANDDSWQEVSGFHYNRMNFAQANAVLKDRRGALNYEYRAAYIVGGERTANVFYADTGRLCKE